MIPTDFNKTFAADASISVQLVEGESGQTKAVLKYKSASAEVYLLGATVTSYKPAGAEELLFVSSKCKYEAGKAIRGGIPVCYPWFGPHPTDPLQPQHGRARITLWTVSETKADSGGAGVTLDLPDAVAPGLGTRLHVVLRDVLEVGLAVKNTSTTNSSYECALHTYLKVDDIRATTVVGLEGGRYIDKLDKAAIKDQPEAVKLSGGADRVYLATAKPLTVNDGRRTIRVTKEGSTETVIWNPWDVAAGKMADMGGPPPHDAGWPAFICVEAANTATGRVVLKPGASHTTKTVIAVG